MYSGKAVFAQLVEWIHPEQFRRCVLRHRGDYKVRRFTCWEQFLAMAFAQVTFRESLADLEMCPRSRPNQLYHLGFGYLILDVATGRIKRHEGIT